MTSLSHKLLLCRWCWVENLSSSLHCSYSLSIASSYHGDDNEEPLEEEEETKYQDEPTEVEIRREVHRIWREKQISIEVEVRQKRNSKRVANYFIRYSK